MAGFAQQASLDSPVSLSVDTEDPCIWLLHVRACDQVGFLFKLSELLTCRGIDVERADITTSEGSLDNRLYLRAAKASDIAEASEWCQELENAVLAANGLSTVAHAESLARASKRLSVNPDLLSVSSFRELECDDSGADVSAVLKKSPPTSIGSSKRGRYEYVLELKGINQAGLLAYISLIFFKSGFSISCAKINTSSGHISNHFELEASNGDAAQILGSYIDIPMCIDSGPVLPWDSINARLQPLKEPASKSSSPRSSCDDCIFEPVRSQLDRTPSTHHYTNGDVYQGSLVCDETGECLREGKGIYTYREDHPEYIRYEGQWCKDQKNGHGVMLVRDGGAYVGQWRKNERHGLGVFFGTTGRGPNAGERPAYRFEGEWVHDKPSGLGIQETTTESEYAMYAGLFENGEHYRQGVKIDFLRSGITGCSVMIDSVWQPFLAVLEEEARNLADRFPVFALGDGDGCGPLAPEPKPVHFGSQPDLQSLERLASKPKADKLPRLANRVFGEARERRWSEDSSPFSGTKGHAHGRPTMSDSLRRSRSQSEDPGATATPQVYFSMDIEISPESPGLRSFDTPKLASNSMARVRRNSTGSQGIKNFRRSLQSRECNPTPRVDDLPSPNPYVPSAPSSPSRQISRQMSIRSIRSSSPSRQRPEPHSPMTRARARSSTPEPRADSGARSCPVLWGEKELAVFIQCIGMPDEAVEKVFKSSFKGAAQLLETMANIETCKELGFTSPLHRLIVRRCLQRLLESDRLENSARGRTLRDVLSDTVLNAHIIPIKELTLEEKLSQGGFGTVFKGSLCLSTKRVGLSAGREYKVAAKAMSVSGGHQMRLYELLKEARVMASLDHPNICKFIGVCADTRPQGQRFIVSELMSGSLFDLIHRPTRIAVNAGLGIPEAVSLSQGISAGLAYIHQHNLVHADLKSSNILISISMHTDACYVPRICDFGHAAVRAAPSPHSRLCTFQWAAPEALRCENLGPAADVFSFGTILWEMLAHRVPHSDLAIGQIQACVGWGKLVPDMKLLPLLPEELFQLLGDCLQFQQEERPSAKEVHQQLLRLPATARKEALRHVRMFFGQDRRESSASCLQGLWHHILKSIGWKPDIL